MARRSFKNQLDISILGLEDINLLRNGESISKRQWAHYILEKMSIINSNFNLNLDEIIEEKKKWLMIIEKLMLTK